MDSSPRSVPPGTPRAATACQWRSTCCHPTVGSSWRSRDKVGRHRRQIRLKPRTPQQMNLEPGAIAAPGSFFCSHVFYEHHEYHEHTLYQDHPWRRLQKRPEIDFSPTTTRCSRHSGERLSPQEGGLLLRPRQLSDRCRDRVVLQRSLFLRLYLRHGLVPGVLRRHPRFLRPALS